MTDSNYRAFLDVKDELTRELAAAFQAKLEAMGEDIRGLSWFSSAAEDYACA